MLLPVIRRGQPVMFFKKNAEVVRVRITCLFGNLIRFEIGFLQHFRRPLHPRRDDVVDQVDLFVFFKQCADVGGRNVHRGGDGRETQALVAEMGVNVGFHFFSARADASSAAIKSRR